MKVLIVEDELLIADYLEMLVEDAGHEVVGKVGDARLALDFLTRSPMPHVVSLDVKLSGDLDGVDLGKELRARGGPPFFFVTGSGDPGARIRCEALSPLAILQKPIDPRLLKQVLDKLERGMPAAPAGGR